MILSIVREHHWSPDFIDTLYLDSQDNLGLEFWYEDIVLMHKELKRK